MQTHFAGRHLKTATPTDSTVEAILSVRPDNHAVLFIHGFHGDATKTWTDFQNLLPASPKCSGRDLFFYGL